MYEKLYDNESRKRFWISKSRHRRLSKTLLPSAQKRLRAAVRHKGMADRGKGQECYRTHDRGYLVRATEFSGGPIMR